MPFYDSEAIERARQVDLLTYLQTCEPQELVHVSGNVYCTKTHDSLRISNGKWCWFSRGIGGYSALDYLIKVNGYSFLEAMETISGRAAIPPPSFVPAPKEEKPKHGIDWRRHNLLSLAGVYQPKKKIEESKLPVALTRFLEDHPHVKTVYLHLDNDNAGRLAAKAIMAVMPEGYRVENKPPPRGKDVNDFLCHRLGIPIRGSQGKEYER